MPLEDSLSPDAADQERAQSWVVAALADAPGFFLAVSAEEIVQAAGGRGLVALGRPSGQLLGRRIAEVWPGLEVHVRRALRGEVCRERIERDGSVFDVDWMHVREAGRVVGAVGVALDVTERERADLEQRCRLGLLQTLAESAPHAIVGTDTEARVCLWNRAAAELFRKSAAEVLGRPVHELAMDAAPKLSELGQRALAGESAAGIPECLPGDQAEPLEFSVSLAPLRGEDGRMLGGVVTWADVTLRRRAERQSADASRVLRGIVDAAPIGITLLDPDGYVRLWSRGAEAMFGWTAEEITGTRLPTVPPGGEQVHFQRLLEGVRRGEALRNFEVRRRRKDGAQLIVSLSTAPLQAASGEVEAVVGVMVDVTEQRRTELAQARLAAIVESSTDAIIGYDLEGTIDAWNPGAESMYGYTKEEALGRSLALLTAPTRVGEDVRILRTLANGQSFHAEETARLRKDGTIVPVSLSVCPLRDATGKVVGGSSIARDISEANRRAAEREAEAGRSRTIAAVSRALAGTRLDVQATMDAIAAGVAEHVGDACVVWSAGPRGAPRPFACGVRAASGMVGTDLGEEPILDALRTRCVVRIEGEADRVLCPIRGMGQSLGVLDATRGPASGPFSPADIALLQDLAERAGLAIEHARLHEEAVRAQKQADDASRRLRQLNRELDHRVEERTRDLRAMLEDVEALSYAMSHELRQPLRSIDGFAASVLSHDAAALSGRSRSDLGRIRAAVGRLNRLVEDLLAITRAVRPQLTIGRFDLSALARDVGSDMAARHPRRRVELVVAPGMEARGDEALLRLVLEHLLGNAWKFTEGREVAHVEVGQRTRDGEVAWFVRDDGVGFDMRWVDQLFRPLRQLNALTAFGGSGIGLATVSRIVRRHHGRVWAEGTPGHGATFWFTLWTEPPAPRGPPAETP